MHQFFVSDSQVYDDHILIQGPDVNHIGKVLRMRPGEIVRISNSQARSWFCEISQITPEEVTAQIQSEDTEGTELPVSIVLYQGLPKSDKMELIIQKAVELGVSAVVPVSMKNCIVKIVDKKADSKTKRLQAIAESAAKQAKRSLIPEVRNAISWKEALQEICQSGQYDLALAAYENERGMEATRELIRSIQPGQKIALLIGPEGGFAPEEIAVTEDDNCMHRISLGRRILRTETAGLAALSMLVYELDH